jgi:hypothetical protein
VGGLTTVQSINCWLENGSGYALVSNRGVASIEVGSEFNGRRRLSGIILTLRRESMGSKRD